MTAAVHRSLSLLSVVFLGLHVVTALIDPYAVVHVTSVVVPFVGSGNPLWVGLGTVSLDLVGTSLLRRRIGVRLWRAIHWLAYLSWPTAFAHTLGMGSDVGQGWFVLLFGLCLGANALSVAWRLTASRGKPARGEGRARAAAGPSPS